MDKKSISLKYVYQNDLNSKEKEENIKLKALAN